MKVAIALHRCEDLGGIINHTEHLAAGFKALGHELELLEICAEGTGKAQQKFQNQQPTVQKEWGTGLPFMQGLGWCFPAENRIIYRKGKINEAREKLSQYDIVIWTIPVPPKNGTNRGNNDWQALYDLPTTTKQVAISHDGNAESYPHLLAIQDCLAGVACVHECSFSCTDYLTIPRTLICNPFFKANKIVEQNLEGENLIPWEDRIGGFLSSQTFKAWKRVDDLIRAIPYLPPKRENERRIICGKGIEWQYMTAEEKCKEIYKQDGKRIWDLALDNGMEHLGWASSAVMNDLLMEMKIVIDPSWSFKYATKGAHWNRVGVEAILAGCILLAQPMAMTAPGSQPFAVIEEDNWTFKPFTPNENYLPLPEPTKAGIAVAKPNSKDYADAIENANSLSNSKVKELQRDGWQMMYNFDAEQVATDFIHLALEGEGKVGTENPMIRKKCNDLLENFYGYPKPNTLF